MGFYLRVVQLLAMVMDNGCLLLGSFEIEYVISIFFSMFYVLHGTFLYVQSLYIFKYFYRAKLSNGLTFLYLSLMHILDDGYIQDWDMAITLDLLSTYLVKSTK
ncbi:hypothetical protein Hanom_Chr17g01545191 [Helianthus anomalus]